MKKSPLSTPSASRMKQKYGWKSYDNNRTGYSPINNDNYPRYSLNGSDMNYANDFIPLNISSPVPEQNRHSGNWYNNGGGRNNRNSCGFYNNRNNYHTPPKPHFNNLYTPYKPAGNKQFHGQKKIYQKGMHRQVDISRYIDVKSFLEDPWADLTKNLNDSKKLIEKKESINADYSSSSILESKTDSEINTSVYTTCEESIYSQNNTESFVDASMTNFNDSSKGSKAVSSVDVKIDNFNSDEKTTNESPSNTVDSSSETSTEELHGSPQNSSTNAGLQSI